LKTEAIIIAIFTLIAKTFLIKTGLKELQYIPIMKFFFFQEILFTTVTGIHGFRLSLKDNLQENLENKDAELMDTKKT